ncbi:MAG: F420-0--gamma-glutamyl ligase [Clostridia bacterium]|nr:coenzyme F420-0:L-glutamate ligase [Eubacteriales bacterium]MDD3867150.1 coenzyme F420-0:L-glutamate ligase [Eubacteriales bacterium]MDD4460986.1 coenzyme F420-0:L-glutamate ligase [Eubacteriales bacterium]NCC49163.1 F420-0--gamma-glutamyl ligase [Clostridia bacterium]
MARLIGTTARGIRAPIVREGDDLVKITTESILEAARQHQFELQDRDIVGVTESLVARAQGNYVTTQQIAGEIKEKFPDSLVVLFPILSRNRFAMILQALAMSGRHIYLMLNYPGDEVGNHLMDPDLMEEQNINPYTDILTEDDYRRYFGHSFKHPFTGLDYLDLYKSLAEEGQIEIILANDWRAALNYSRDVLIANIHDRQRLKKRLKSAGGRHIYGLDDLCRESIDGSGYNADYGLLGSNQADAGRLKLFPRDCQAFVEAVQDALRERTGRQLEVMIYGDGAFKDPQGKIWELADPVVSPGYTAGLAGTPNEIKMKYVIDNELSRLDASEMADALRDKIRGKGTDLVGQAASAGTTPRQLTDLLGSLCDLVSGSGDKGTPIILVQGYFDSYAAD